MPKKFVIYFVGYSCTGKSTVEKILGTKLPGSYTVHFDRQKWLLSGYHRDKDRPLINQITRGLFEVVCKTGTPILLHGPVREEALFRWYQDVAKANGYTAFVTVHLTAPEDVLLSRFRARVENALREKSSTISVTDETVFRENLAKTFFVPADALTFDTAVTSAEEIAQKVVGHLSSL